MFFVFETGALKPCQKTPKRMVPEGIERPDYADHPQVLTTCNCCFAIIALFLIYSIHLYLAKGSKICSCCFSIFFLLIIYHLSKGIPISEQEDKAKNTAIKVYTDEELRGIREACRIGREVLDIAGRAVRVGITCDELDRIVHEATVERGAYPSPLNYHRFPKSVCTSVNEVPFPK